MMMVKDLVVIAELEFFALPRDVIMIESPLIRVSGT